MVGSHALLSLTSELLHRGRENKSVAYQPPIRAPLVAFPFKRSMAVFVAMLIMRYVPGWVLNGNAPVVVEVTDDTALEEVIETTEDVEARLGCGVDVFLSSCDAESPPPTPPPIAAPKTTSAIAKTIQNPRVESPHMRAAGSVDVLGSS